MPTFRSLACLATFVLGCAASNSGDDDDDGTGSAGTASSGNTAGTASGNTAGEADGAPAADCAERCAAKAEACMAPPDVATSSCAGLCGESPTSMQLDCLEDAECSALAQPNPCGIGADDPGTTTTPGTTDDTGGAPAQLGEACTCPADSDFCQSTEGPCAAELWCLLDVCASECDPDASMCPSGYECAEWLLDGVGYGFYCLGL